MHPVDANTSFRREFDRRNSPTDKTTEFRRAAVLEFLRRPRLPDNVMHQDDNAAHQCVVCCGTNTTTRPKWALAPCEATIPGLLAHAPPRKLALSSRKSIKVAVCCVPASISLGIPQVRNPPIC